MANDCFYKVKVTQDNKTETYHWGYFPYSWVMKDVKQLYRNGADAVVLEMITQEQFDRRMEKYKNQQAWEEYQTNGIWNGEEE